MTTIILVTLILLLPVASLRWGVDSRRLDAGSRDDWIVRTGTQRSPSGAE